MRISPFFCSCNIGVDGGKAGIECLSVGLRQPVVQRIGGRRLPACTHRFDSGNVSTDRFACGIESVYLRFNVDEPFRYVRLVVIVDDGIDGRFKFGKGRRFDEIFVIGDFCLRRTDGGLCGSERLCRDVRFRRKCVRQRLRRSDRLVHFCLCECFRRVAARDLRVGGGDGRRKLCHIDGAHVLRYIRHRIRPRRNGGIVRGFVRYAAGSRVVGSHLFIRRCQSLFIGAGIFVRDLDIETKILRSFSAFEPDRRHIYFPFIGKKISENRNGGIARSGICIGRISCIDVGKTIHSGTDDFNFIPLAVIFKGKPDSICIIRTTENEATVRHTQGSRCCILFCINVHLCPARAVAVLKKQSPLSELFPHGQSYG